ncbi:hypothetical protein RINTHH_4240 [Richelia intracellularis HH01]|uniref:Uncharacterized protein n=1 Tax=Richelia intracellularis HH01 TaxID=1165094 RepID=M1WQU1_9NOST|nr:hypothetical protein RINTHH_4240 [Richelia intracellularis HH01]
MINIVTQWQNLRLIHAANLFCFAKLKVYRLMLKTTSG